MMARFQEGRNSPSSTITCCHNNGIAMEEQEQIVVQGTASPSGASEALEVPSCASLEFENIHELKKLTHLSLQEMNSNVHSRPLAPKRWSGSTRMLHSSAIHDNNDNENDNSSSLLSERENDFEFSTSRPFQMQQVESSCTSETLQPVRFSEVTIVEYERNVLPGDDGAIRREGSEMLHSDLKYKIRKTVSLDDYEKVRKPKRRTRQELLTFLKSKNTAHISEHAILSSFRKSKRSIREKRIRDAKAPHKKILKSVGGFFKKLKPRSKGSAIKEDDRSTSSPHHATLKTKSSQKYTHYSR